MFVREDGCEESERSLFVASNGWLNNFMRRNGLSLRRKPTTAQQDPERLTDKLISYILHVRRLSIKFKYQPSNIIAMDETPRPVSMRRAIARARLHTRLKYGRRVISRTPKF